MIFEKIAGHDIHPEVKIVDMWEWSKADSNTVLETDGLGPCIGIVAYDPYTKVGHMAHFPDPEDDGFNKFAASVLGNASSVDNLKMWLRGGEITLKYVEDSRQKRVDIEKAVLALGVKPENLDIAWNDVYGDIVRLSLDCANGELSESSLNEYDIDGYDDYSEAYVPEDFI